MVTMVFTGTVTTVCLNNGDMMKRLILSFKRGVCGCCPGHDQFPNDTYKSRRSKKARSRDKKVEHQMARTLMKRNLKEILSEPSNP